MHLPARRRLVAAFLLTFGFFALSAAFLLRFSAADRLVLAPVGIETTRTFVGQDNGYFDLSTVKRVNDASLITTVTVRGVASLSTRQTAVWDSFTITADESTGKRLEASSWRLAFDRRTGRLTGCCGAGIDRDTSIRQTGLGFLWPVGDVLRRDYAVFDPTTRRTWPAVYDGEETVEGVRTYRFVQRVEPTPVAEIEQMAGTELGLAPKRRYDVDRVYDATITTWIDPRTGFPVDQRRQENSTLRTEQGIDALSLSRVDVRMDVPSRQAAALRANGYAADIRAVKFVIPVSAGLLGALLIAVGAVVAARPGRLLRWAARFLRPVLGVCAVGFLGFRLYRSRPDVIATLEHLSPGAFASALAFVVAGLVCMMLAWRTILADLGSPLPLRAASRIMFVGQLGKYVPGSVWALVGMSELALDHGVPRRRTLGAATISLALTLGCALALSVTRLPPRFWPALALLLIGLHPRVLGFVLDRLLRLARREPLEQVVSAAGMLRATGWTLLGWLLWGSHVWVLAGAVSRPSLALWPLAVGAYALAWASGILAVLAPAGLGVLEGALLLTLTPELGATAALTVTVVTRVTLVLADLVVAGTALLASLRLAGRKNKSPRNEVEPEYPAEEAEDARLTSALGAEQHEFT
jgi:hypothetical protein